MEHTGRVSGDGPAGPQREVLWKAFAAVVSSVPQVRDWTGRQLRRLEVSGEHIDRMKLLVTEVASNAVRHTDGAEILVMLHVNSHLEGAVRDQDPAAPTPRHAQPDDLDGRGLVLIGALADAWGVRPAPIGKWVWFRINRSPGP